MDGDERTSQVTSAESAATTSTIGGNKGMLAPTFMETKQWTHSQQQNQSIIFLLVPYGITRPNGLTCIKLHVLVAQA